MCIQVKGIPSLTIFEKIKEQAGETVVKIVDFILDHMSIIFFGLSVLFSYYMMPASGFAYLGYWTDLSQTFIEGAMIGASALVVKNILTPKPFSKTQSKIINYLTGLINIGQSYLNPTFGFSFSVVTSGFILIKTLFGQK